MTRMDPRRSLRWLERGALVIGLLSFGLWTRAQVRSWTYQSSEARKLAAKRSTALGRIEIPRLGIDAIVAEGTDARTLDLAVGHIPETARPGSPGNCGLAGHRDTFFRHLGDVHDGDLVRFSTADRTYDYAVEWSRVVAPDRIDTLDPTPTPSLTLVTCYPFTYVGRAPKRFVVRARQVETADGPLAVRATQTHARHADVAPVLMAAGR